MSELRFDPLLGEWLATATRRQDRTFLPPADFCPLCPTLGPEAFPTEVPEADYDLVAFENLFPSLRIDPEVPAIEDDDLYRVRPAQGVCEVILYSPDHDTSLAAEPVEQIYKLIKVWRHRFEELSKHDFVKYVFIFENKGEAVGVTLHHPHGQIYAYPFVPPIILRELEQSRRHHEASGRCLICDLVTKEEDAGDRIVTANDHFAAYIPFFARYPYEVHVVPRTHRESLAEFSPAEERSLAETLKQVLSAYDRLFDRPFPYIMVLHHAPSDGGNYGYYHFHIEFYPPMRSKTKLKYLAGSEVGTGMFINDTLAEEKAVELRNLVEPVRWR